MNFLFKFFLTNWHDVSIENRKVDITIQSQVLTKNFIGVKIQISLVNEAIQYRKKPIHPDL